MWGYMGNYDANWGWGMGFGMIGMTLFWIFVILVIVALLKSLFTGTRSPPERERDKTALDILKERYARGEIERDEFEQKRRDLGGT